MVQLRGEILNILESIPGKTDKIEKKSDREKENKNRFIQSYIHHPHL